MFSRIWNERAMQYAELRDPDRSIHLLRYEELVERDEATLGLLAELAGISRDEIDSVLNVNLNSARTEGMPATSSRSGRFVGKGWSGFVMRISRKVFDVKLEASARWSLRSRSLAAAYQ